MSWREGGECSNHWSGWRGNLGETVVETNGGARELAVVSDNEEVCWLHDWKKSG